MSPDNSDAGRRGTQTLRERVDAAIERMGDQVRERLGDPVSGPAGEPLEAKGLIDLSSGPGSKPLPIGDGEGSLDGTSSQVPGE